MSADSDYTAGRKFTYLYQENFFDAVPRPDFPVVGIPSRTLSTFWAKDVLPSALALRKIYVRGYKENDESLKIAWDWFQESQNRKLMDDIILESPNASTVLPTEVALNWQTCWFFKMDESFGRPDGAENYEPFIAFKPGTKDFLNDLRRLTFDEVDRVRRRPEELHNSAKASKLSLTNCDWLVDRLRGDIQTLQYFETVDVVTWFTLMRYYIGLVRREREALRIRSPKFL